MGKRLKKADVLRYARELKSPFEETQGDGNKLLPPNIQGLRNIIAQKIAGKPPTIKR